MASAFLLDTNILIWLIRGKGAAFDAISESYDLTALSSAPIITFVTVGELRAFALWRGWGRKRLDTLDDLLSKMVVARNVDPTVTDAYSKIEHYSATEARVKMHDNDMWIAAFAHVLQATLLTTDTDFNHLHPTFLSRHLINQKTGDIER